MQRVIPKFPLRLPSHSFKRYYSTTQKAVKMSENLREAHNQVEEAASIDRAPFNPDEMNPQGLAHHFHEEAEKARHKAQETGNTELLRYAEKEDELARKVVEKKGINASPKKCNKC